MKQKQVKASPKAAKQTKTVKTPPKKVPVVVEEDDDEEEEVVQEKVVAKKPMNKKVAKAKQVVVEPEVEEEEDEQEEDDENVAEEDDEESDAEMEDDDEQEEGDDDDEQEEGDDDDDEQEEGDDDDDEPTEETKEEPTIPSKVKIGPIPLNTIPLKQIIHISRLPKHCQPNNIVEAFAKYGPIEQINIVRKSPTTFADVAYKTSEAALAAIASVEKVKVLGRPVIVREKRDKNVSITDLGNDCKIIIKNIKTGTTATELCKHFESCGEIEFFNLIETPKHYSAQGAHITFTNRDAVESAMKLHNSILNGLNIKIRKDDKRGGFQPQYEENLTVVLKNKQELTSIELDTIKSIFSKCGEVEYIDAVCKKEVLAIVMFKTEEAAQKALKMNGQTKNGVELDLIPFSPLKINTSIHIMNLPGGCTEEDLRNHFAKVGEIAYVDIKGFSAIIRFEDTDGYCKSFLYNASFLKRQPIFIEPHSPRKNRMMAKFNKGGFKRPFENGHKRPFENGKKNPFENGHTAFRAKKFKQN